MPLSITEIQAALALGGARPTLFSVTLTAPAGGIGISSAAIVETPFLIHAATLPESALGTIQVPYYGRKIKLYGDRTFQPWTVSVLNDEDFLIRNMLEIWSENMNSLQGNLLGFASSAPALYKSSALVTQYSKTGLPIRQYTFNGIWPSIIAPIEVNWSSNDQIESFNCTFEYDFWSQASITGTSIN
jgi:hypothetical protein